MDLPDPDTPVIHSSKPSGKSASIPFILFSLASVILSVAVFFRLTFGISITSFLLKYFPVIDLLFFSMSFKEPFATISPPLTPAPGPMSTI